MKVEVTGVADEDLNRMDWSQREKFIKHIRKISEMPPSRHFRDFYVEQVSDGRLIYQIDFEKEIIYIIRCFVRHKEYDKWCDSFR